MQRVLTWVRLWPASFDPAPFLRRLYRRLALWHQRARTRRQLAQLDTRALADVGITQAEREAELAKPFWR